MKRSRFTRKRLLKKGIPADQIEDYLDRVDLLPNLQLLAGGPNIEFFKDRRKKLDGRLRRALGVA